jgi:hypothetical protein
LPSQRQQLKQSPVPAQTSQGEQGEQEVVVPSQVTCPGSLAEQLRSTAVQLLLPWQETELGVVEPHCAVALQIDLRGLPDRRAAKSTSLCWVRQEAGPAAGLRIAAMASPLMGAMLGVWARSPLEMKRRTHAESKYFFMGLLLWFSLSSPADPIAGGWPFPSAHERPRIFDPVYCGDGARWASPSHERTKA